MREPVGAARTEREPDRAAGEVPRDAVERVLRRRSANGLAVPGTASRLERPLAGASALEPAVGEALSAGAREEDQCIWGEDLSERAL